MDIRLLANRFVRLVFMAALLVMPTFASYAPRASAAGPSEAAEVINWNKIARRVIVTEAKLSPGHSFVYMSYVQAAVYDAVVSIEGGYEPYSLHLGRQPGASARAAVATAAHDVLVHYFPAQKTALDADYATALAAIPNPIPKDRGIQLGKEAAAGIIALRQGDGLEADIGFVMPSPAPGVWQLPAGVAPLTPWISVLRPFMLQKPDQFRPGPPPSLTSEDYAVGFNEVKKYGGEVSAERTAEETDVAKFWTAHPVVQYNTAFELLITDRKLKSAEAARLYAMGNLVATDAVIACWDAKYNYLFWRPQFSVPGAAADGNSNTAADPNWKPLVATPPHPEYPGAHGCVTSAVAEMFGVFLGTKQIDLDITSTAPGVVKTTRHFDTVDDLKAEVVNARTWGGIHYRGSSLKGGVLGKKIADWTLSRYFLPEQCKGSTKG